MKSLLIAAILFSSAALSAQAVSPSEAAPASKVNTAIRADVAARPVTHNDAPATVGDIRVKTARTGGKTVTLQNGALPEAQASNPSVGTPGA